MPATQPPIEVCSVPFESGSNPYLETIHRALGRHGVTVVAPADTGNGLSYGLRPGRILHFHWPSMIYGAAEGEAIPGAAENWRRLLASAENQGCFIVWTAHNLYPHESSGAWDKIARREFVSYCDHVIVHCDCAADLIAREFGAPAKITVLRHPCYDYDAAGAAERTMLRNRLGIGRDDFVFLMFGILRQYKKPEFALEAFSRLSAANAKLLIVGGVHKSYDPDRLRALIATEKRAAFMELETRDDELPDLFAAADVGLFCADTALSSGSIALAQSFAKPVIAPRAGCMAEMVPPEAGELYDGASSHSLTEAMTRIINRDLTALGAAGRDLIARQTSDGFAAKLSQIYRDLLSGR